MFERIKKALQKGNATQTTQSEQPVVTGDAAQVEAASQAELAQQAEVAPRPARTGKPSKQLKRALLGLKAFDEGLYERAVEYVHSGAGPEILTEVAGSPDPELLHYLGSPGKFQRWPRGVASVDKKLKELGFKPEDNSHYGMQYALQGARREFYLAETDPVRIARYGRFIAQLGGGPDRGIKLAPPYLHALVNDFVMVAPNDAKDREQYLSKASKITPEFIEEIATADGTPVDQLTVLELLFQVENNAWGMDTWPYQFNGVTQWATNAVPAIDVQAMSKLLTAQSKVELITRVPERAGGATSFIPVWSVMAGDNAKTVRDTAILSLETLSREDVVPELEKVAAVLPASRAGTIIDFLAKSPEGQGAIARLIESGAKSAALAQKIAQQVNAVTETLPQNSFEIPPVVPLGEELNETAVRADIEAYIQREIAAEDPARQWTISRAKSARKVTPKDIDTFIDVAAGRKSREDVKESGLLSYYGDHIMVNALKSLTFPAVVNLIPLKNHLYWAARAHVQPDMDLRTIEHILHARGRTGDQILSYYGQYGVDAEHAWPWFAEHTDALLALLDDGQEGGELALDVLQEFPAYPEPLVQALAARAMSSGKIVRKFAQAALMKHPAARALAEQGLEASTTDAVVTAANWLAKIKDSASIPALEKALKTEKRDLVRASLLGALKELGGDVSEHLSEPALTAAAAKGLKGKTPASLEWFPFDSVPAVHWADGSPVSPDVIKWWIITADKMKNPDGSGIISLYLNLLAPADREALSTFVVRAWLAQDTRTPSEEEAREYGETDGKQKYAWAQQSLKAAQARGEEPASWVATRASISLEFWIKESYTERLREYLGTAQADKGLLAFAAGMPGLELGNAVLAYNKNHKARRAQIEALVYALYGNGQQQALQVLMSIARRHHQRSVKETANKLVEQVAEDRGWTTEELADRTIPTAGFDDDGVLRLDFGEREFTGRMTDAGTIELTNPQGKTVKALPKPSGTDDEELASESRKQLTASRKELKAVIALQTSRLYEAMCAERTWTASDWTDFLRNHPIMGRLVTHLVWIARSGDSELVFRPTEDGEILGIDDASVELPQDAQILVAHTVMLSQADVDAWRAHLADYEVTPLFDQFANALPEFEPTQTEFTDLKGHMTDTFSFRGVATKRGYQRGAAQDAGWFYEYTKDFSHLGLSVQLEFTGSFLPEENIACATESLAFRSRRGKVQLSTVPKILIAEAYADYAALAALGAYDPNYRTKSEY